MLEKNLTRGVEPIVDACDLLDGLRKFLVSPRREKQLGEGGHQEPQWLKKRGLSWEKFQQLARGKLPIVPQEIACRHRTNMLRGGELESLISPLEHQTMQGAGAGPSMGHPRIEALPVFRHGSEAARICDEALSVMGPTDSRISRIIQSDQNAQMAFHIHKALGYALDEYKNFTGRGTSGHYSGFGDVFRSGPSEQHGGPPGAWGGVMGGSGGGQVNMGGSQQRGMGGQQGGMGVPPGGMGGSGLQQQGGPGFIGGGSYQQANQMANRLQQMAMEENGGRGGGRRSLEYQGGGHGHGQGYHQEEEYGGAAGGMKRQMHSQGGNRGKKNRGGWNR